MEEPVETVEIENLRRVESLSEEEKRVLVCCFPSCTLKYLDYLAFMSYSAYNSLVLPSGVIRPLEPPETSCEAIAKVERYTPMGFSDWMDYLDAHCDNEASGSLVDEISTYFECLDKGLDPFTVNGEAEIKTINDRYLYRVLKLFIDLSETLTRIIRISYYCSLKTNVRKWYELLVTSLSTIFTSYLQNIEWNSDHLVFSDIRMAEHLLRSIGDQTKTMYELNDQLLNDTRTKNCRVLNVKYMKFLESQTNIDETHISYLNPSDSTNIYVDNSGEEIRVWTSDDLSTAAEFVVIWSPKDQNVFFKALARFSIHFIDCIQRLLPHKTKDDIKTFYDILKDGVEHHVKTTELKTGYEFMSNVETAYEASDEWEKFETQNADVIANFEFESSDLPLFQSEIEKSKLKFEIIDDSGLTVDDDSEKEEHFTKRDIKNIMDTKCTSDEESGVFFKLPFDDDEFHLNKIYQKQVKSFLDVDSSDQLKIDGIHMKEKMYKLLEDYGKRYLKKLMKEIVQNHVNNRSKYLHLGITNESESVSEADVWNAVENIPCMPQTMIYNGLDNISNYLHFTSDFNKFNGNFLVDLNVLTRRPVMTYIFERQFKDDNVEKYCEMIYMIQDCIEKSNKHKSKLSSKYNYYLNLMQDLPKLIGNEKGADDEVNNQSSIKIRSLDELCDDTDSDGSEIQSEIQSESESVSEDEQEGDINSDESVEYESANEEINLSDGTQDPYDSSISTDNSISHREDNENENDLNGPPRKKQKILALLEDASSPALITAKFVTNVNSQNGKSNKMNNEIIYSHTDSELSSGIESESDYMEAGPYRIASDEGTITQSDTGSDSNEEENDINDDNISSQQLEELESLENDQFRKNENRKLNDFISFGDNDVICDETDDINEASENQLDLMDHSSGTLEELDLIDGIQMGKFFDGNLTKKGILKMKDDITKFMSTN